MPRARLAPTVLTLVAIALAATACAGTPRQALARADLDAHAGRTADALRRYDAAADRKDASDADRLAALVGAAHACDALGDADGARRRLERAVGLDVPGAVEPVEYDLAERLRDQDHARALALYYRAAAGAERHRAGGFPYHAAMDRILQMSLAPR
jgi:tetratricopeptide (TPR) repeat protein